MLDKTNQIIQSIDGMQRAKANPFLVGKVLFQLNEIKENKGWNGFAIFLSKPIVSMSLIVIIIALNFFILTLSWKNISSNNNEAMVAQSDEYSLAMNSFFDYSKMR